MDKEDIIKKALLGERGEDQQRIAQEGVKWLEQLLRKNNDYGTSVWKVPVFAPNTDVSSAIFVRMSDKVERINSLLQKQEAEISESLEDTISDLGSYCLLWLTRPQ